VTLRGLMLDTFARAPDAGRLRAAWSWYGARSFGDAGRTFARLLAAEGCAGDLLARLGELDLMGALTRDMDSALRDRARADALRMLGVRAQLDDLLAACGGAGVELTLLKGAAFMALGMRPHRPCNDLDVLVDREAVETVVRLLTEAGYRPFATPDPRAVHHLPPFIRDRSAAVEVHRRALLTREAPGVERHFTVQPSPDEADDSAAALTTVLVRPGLQVLTPTDWCWHAFAHEAGHRETCGSVRGALDIASLMDRWGGAIDWPIVAARTQGWPDDVGPLAISVRRLGLDVPVRAGAGTRLAARLADAAREWAARRAATDDGFAFAARKIGGLAFGNLGTWRAHRAGAPRTDASQVAAGAVGGVARPPAIEPPVWRSMLSDGARLVRVLIGLP
jgi:hypothetical protein